MVHFQESEQALDDLHPRLHTRGLQGDIGDAVDLDARRDLDPQRGVPREGKEASGHGAEICRVLGLQIVKETVRSKIYGHVITSRVGFLSDLHARARADATGAGGDHLLRIRVVADAS